MAYPLTDHEQLDDDAFESYAYEQPLAPAHERLMLGIVPASIPLLLVIVYIALYIIRPWDLLIPALAVVRFEFCFALLMIAVVVFSGRIRVRFDLQSLGVFLFLAVYALSALSAWRYELIGDAVYNQMARTVFFVILASAVVVSLYDLYFVAAAYIGTMAVYLAKSHWEFWIHGRGEYRMGVKRLIGIESTFGAPNSLAMSVIVSLPILWFLWRTRADFTAGWPRFWSAMYRRMLLCYAVLSAATVVLTNSRSGMLGFIVFVALTSLQGRGLGRKLLLVLGGCMVLATVWLLAPQDSRNRLRTVWDPSAGPSNAQTSAQMRVASFKASLEIFQRFPLNGVGPGKNFNEYRRENVDGADLAPHNLPGEILSCFGLLGAGAFLWMIGATLFNARRLRRIGRGLPGPAGRTLPRLAAALRDSVFLLLFLGLAGHCADRFNWLWLAAFGIHGMILARDAEYREAEHWDMEPAFEDETDYLPEAAAAHG